MYSELSPMSSPENVACYEECVTDEPYLPSPLPASSRHGVPRSQASGRISKKGRRIRACGGGGLGICSSGRV